MAIIGSGPAGLAVADGLSKMGHAVSVFERDNAIGGLLRYGIPNVKLDKKAVVERRLSLMRENGVEFFPKTNVDFEMMESLKSSYSAVVVCAGFSFSLISFIIIFYFYFLFIYFFFV